MDELNKRLMKVPEKDRGWVGVRAMGVVFSYGWPFPIDDKVAALEYALNEYEAKKNPLMGIYFK